MHEGEKVVPRSGGVYVGESLPPVSVKLAKKILSGEYVEMEELLPEMCTLEDDPPEPKRRLLPETSIRHIYLAAMLWSLRQHSWGLIAGGYR